MAGTTNAAAPAGNTRALVLATLAFTASFYAWSMLGPLGPDLQDLMGLSELQLAMLIAVPVLLGSMLRIPLGVLTDRYGGRRVFTALMVFTLLPLTGLAAWHDSFPWVVFCGLFLGFAGASFAVGVPFVSRWYPPEKQGIALGIYGMGMGGTVLAGLTAPRIADQFGLSAPFIFGIVLVAVMAVNNETGAIQDIGAIGRAIASSAASLGIRPPLFHVDCVQALGKIPLDFSGGNVTSAAFSAHKIQGPKGVGALWHAKPIEALAVGGGQEGGLRSGTENIFGILSFAACAAKAVPSMPARLEHALLLEASLLQGLKRISGASAVPLGREPRDPRYSPWIISAAFPGLGGEVFARALSDAGIARVDGVPRVHIPTRQRAAEFSMPWGCPKNSPSPQSAYRLARTLALKKSSVSCRRPKTCIED